MNNMVLSNLVNQTQKFVGVIPLWLPLKQGRHGGTTPTRNVTFTTARMKHILLLSILGVSGASIAFPVAAQTSPTAPEDICISGFNFIGNQAFDADKLSEIAWNAIEETPSGDCTRVSFADILQARSAVTQHYINAGYVTSGAYIPAAQEVRSDGGTVTIEIVEGELTDIDISGNRGLNENYISSRLRSATSTPLNRNDLVEALQFLRLDPAIDNITAELSPGIRPGTNILRVEVEETNPFEFTARLDNNRSPSVSTLRRGGEASYRNLFGVGDLLSASYFNTDGSDEINLGYEIPFNPQNGTIGFRYRLSDSEVVEEPFNPLDIQSDYRSYQLEIRQPIVREVDLENAIVRDFTLGFNFDRQESDTSILGVDFPLSLGANEDGETRISAFRLSQEFTQRSNREVFAARSQFSLGVGWFDSTVNAEAPDSRFFAWRTQLQWFRRLSRGRGDPPTAPALLLRSDLQLSTQSLVPIEQFGLGGQATVRGYRQDALLGDNGFLASAELLWPVWRWTEAESVLSVVPFVDFGTVWNTSREDLDDSTLVGVGLGLQWQQSDRLRARLDWGIPLVDLDSGEEESWQENGVYFTIEYNLF